MELKIQEWQKEVAKSTAPVWVGSLERAYCSWAGLRLAVRFIECSVDEPNYEDYWWWLVTDEATEVGLKGTYNDKLAPPKSGLEARERAEQFAKWWLFVEQGENERNIYDGERN